MKDLKTLIQHYMAITATGMTAALPILVPLRWAHAPGWLQTFLYMLTAMNTINIADAIIPLGTGQEYQKEKEIEKQAKKRRSLQ